MLGVTVGAMLGNYQRGADDDYLAAFGDDYGLPLSVSDIEFGEDT